MDKQPVGKNEYIQQALTGYSTDNLVGTKASYAPG